MKKDDTQITKKKKKRSFKKMASLPLYVSPRMSPRPSSSLPFAKQFTSMPTMLGPNKISSAGISCLTMVAILKPEDTHSLRVAFVKKVYSMVTQLFGLTLIAMCIWCLCSDSLLWVNVLISMAITPAIVIPVTAIAYSTSIDITYLWGWQFLAVAFVLLVVIGIVYCIMLTLITRLIFQTAFLLIDLLYLAITTQMVFGDLSRGKIFPIQQFIRAGAAVYLEVTLVFFYIPGIDFTAK